HRLRRRPGALHRTAGLGPAGGVRDPGREAVLMSEHRWYAIQTTAGHENKVRSLIERRIKDDPRPEEEKPIRQALVPTQEVVEIKNGKKVTAERKIYPGYVLVNMVLNQETIHVINGIQGVIKFVGTGRLPMPLRPEEVNRLLGIEEAAKEEEPQETIPFLIGQVVEITEGPFSDFSGTVEEVTIYKDPTFTFITKTPPAAVLLKKEAGIEKGSPTSNRQKVGKVTRAQLKKIAEIKMPDLNANDLDAAMKMVAGTARSMGLEVVD